jgi:U4/U6.U5 tri-snRNP-associated protein 1
LKPLELDSGPKEGSDIIKDDLGEFRHKPAINTAEKERTQKIKEKISTMKQKRQIEHSLATTKTLGESDSDDDTLAWIKKNRKIQEEKKKAAERVCY